MHRGGIGRGDEVGAARAEGREGDRRVRAAGPAASPSAACETTAPGAGGEPVPCPRCGARAHVTPNPYFGTGLAVHRAVLLCAACGYAGLQDNEPAAVEVVEPPHPTGPLQRVLALIRHA
jgi:hypothetical protein